MLKKKIVCLILVLCAALVLTACGQQQETYPNQPRQDTGAAQQQAPVQEQVVAEAPAQQINFNDGSYDPASEEGGQSEQVIAETNAATAAPVMQSEYAGATPVKIDPVDKPTPTPLPKLTFSYNTYNASNLHLTFEGPAGWMVNDLAVDSYTLTNPDPSMDYAAQLSIRLVPVSKNYTKNELIKEIKGVLDTLSSEGFKKFERSNTAGRKFMNTDAIYANYTGTTTDNVKVAGRIIIACSNKTLYILHVSYPQGYTKTYVENVYDKFRHSVKTITK